MNLHEDTAVKHLSQSICEAEDKRILEELCRRADMTRALTDHLVPGSKADSMQILVTDEPGDGGANHEYEICFEGEDGKTQYHKVKFQKGPAIPAGLNGVTNEALLTILLDRMRGFQSGQFKCRENAIALTHMEEALMWLQKRTRERILRGVEGTTKA